MTARSTIEASASAYYGVPLGSRNLVSGRDMPTEDVAGWAIAFTDDFDTDVALGSFPAAVSAKWDAFPLGYTDTSGQGKYNPAKTIHCAGSKMNLRCWWEDGQAYPWVPNPRPIVIPGSALPYTHDFGRIAYRWRLKSQTVNPGTGLSGYKIAWLNWPSSNRHVGPIALTGAISSGSANVTITPWVASYPPYAGQSVSGTGIQAGTKIASYTPGSSTLVLDKTATATNGAVALTLSGGDGELDFPEITDFGAGDGTEVEVHCFVHHQGGVTSNIDQTHIGPVVVDVTQWHTMILEWSEDLVVAYIDTVEIGRVTTADIVGTHGAAQGVPRTPMSFRIQTETAIGRTTVDTDEMELELDWVAIWLPE